MSAPAGPSWIDIHSHLVPGVDDGARDMAAALASIQRMADEGIRHILTTPHIQGSLTLEEEEYEERLSTVSEAFRQTAAAVAKDVPDVEFSRGHEVLIDVPEVDLSDRRIRLAGTSFVLIEWPRLQIPPGTARVIRRIREQGYRPIIAHPERYFGMSQRMSVAGEWRSAGAYLQANYGSLLGRYGSEARAAVLRLLKEGWVDYMASDFHGHSSLKIYKDEACTVFEERDAMATIELLGCANPARLLLDQEPLAAPPLDTDPTLLNRLRDMWRPERA